MRSSAEAMPKRDDGHDFVHTPRMEVVFLSPRGGERAQGASPRDVEDFGADMTADDLIVEIDKAIRAVFGPGKSLREVPGGELPEETLSDEERRLSAALMRVNHSGEICAQALYQGQAWVAQAEWIRAVLRKAADEEGEHLAWTQARLHELGGRKSLLNPLWYAGALAAGALAGKLGDAWNLGFLAETERQVEAHLSRHLRRLPEKDRKSRAIVERMKIDEAGHAQTAERLGAKELPEVVKSAMRCLSGIMTRTAYWL